MSSRTAVCGHPPVSTAAMRSADSASLRTRNSASSFVKMSLVTTASSSSLAQRAAERQQECRLAAADRTADSHRERPRLVVAREAACPARGMPRRPQETPDRVHGRGGDDACVAEAREAPFRTGTVANTADRVTTAAYRQPARSVRPRRPRDRRSVASHLRAQSRNRTAAAAPGSCRRCRA